MRMNRCWLVLGLGALLSACDESSPAPTPTPPTNSTNSTSQDSGKAYRFSFELKKKIGLPGLGGAIAFSPDGKLLVVNVRRHGTLLWDAVAWPDEPEISKFDRDRSGFLDAVEFSPSGKWLVIGTSEPPVLQLVEWADREVKARFEARTLEGFAGASAVPWNVLFSKDESLVFTGWQDGGIRILKTPDLKHVVTLHEGETGLPLVFDDEAKRLITIGGPTATGDTSAPARELGCRVWSSSPWQLLALRPEQPYNHWDSILWDAETVVSIRTESSGQSKLSLWSWKSFKPQSESLVDAILGPMGLHEPTRYVLCARAEPLTSGDKQVRCLAMLDPRSGKWTEVLAVEAIEKQVGRPISEFEFPFWGLGFSSDGRAFATVIGQTLLVYTVSFEEQR